MESYSSTISESRSERLSLDASHTEETVEGAGTRARKIYIRPCPEDTTYRSFVPEECIDAKSYRRPA